jgi:hypothetical protein
MPEIIIEVPTANAAKLSAFTSDDTVGRQSITTREASALGLPGNVLYVRISGGEAGVAHATKLAKEQELGKILAPADAAKVAKAIDDEEASAAEGMGLIDF